MMTDTIEVSKHYPAPIQTADGVPPVMLSPISIAHQTEMHDGQDDGSSRNSVRDQWVANLKRRQLAGAPTGLASCTIEPTGAQEEKSKSANSTPKKSSLSAVPNTGKNSSGQSRQGANKARSKGGSRSSGTRVKKNAPSLTSPTTTLFFNELGFFELQSPCLNRISPRIDYNGTNASIGTHDSNLFNYPMTSSKTSTKPQVRKRTNNALPFDLASCTQPRPSTPRRKLNSGKGAFTSLDGTDAVIPDGFDDGWTPSRLSPESNKLWGPDLDLMSPNQFADTFMDIPTPKWTDIPTVSVATGKYNEVPATFFNEKVNDSELSSRGGSEYLSDPIERTKSQRHVRADSADQQALSKFFEQANIDSQDSNPEEEDCHVSSSGGKDGNEDNNESNRRKSGSNNYRFERKSSRKGSRINIFDSSTGNDNAYNAEGRASRKNSTNSIYAFNLDDIGYCPPQGRRRMSTASNDSRSGNDVSLQEFDTMLDEYQFADLDQELDKFYVDIDKINQEDDCTTSVKDDTT